MNKYIKSRGGFLLTLFLLASCSEAIDVSDDYSLKFDGALSSYAYMENAESPADRIVDLYAGGAERKITVGITKSTKHDVDFSVTYDESLLQTDSESEETQFDPFPEQLVSITNEGATTILAGNNKSEVLGISISSSENLEQGKTYVIPLRVETKDANIKLSDAQKQYFFYVKYFADRISPDKKAGFKVVSCMTPRDVDPRWHCEFFLKNEKKPLFDIVVLFSGNMNYDVNTGRVYLQTDPPMTTILHNRERYLKPLQDMGIKIVLGVMGNWDAAGISTLQRPVAEQFARELQAAATAFDLDGFFWDDEYTLADPSIPGFTNPDKDNASRLIYEVKRLMPDKLNMVYQYATIKSLNTVDDVLPGHYVDYIVADYSTSVVIGNWPGASKKQGMPYPYEFAQWKKGHPAEIKNNDWGGIMLFSMSQKHGNWANFQLPALTEIASTMFEDELDYSGKVYPLEF